MKVTFELTVDEFKRLFGSSVVNNVVCELNTTDEFEPDWDNAPEWAEWHAVDLDGNRCWFERAPYIESEECVEWESVWSTKYYIYTDNEVTKNEVKNWKESARKRPR